MIRWLQVVSGRSRRRAPRSSCSRSSTGPKRSPSRQSELQRELDQENETLSLLQAEWSLLIQPARVQELVRASRRAPEAAAARPGADHQVENLPMRPTGPAPDDEAALSAILEDTAHEEPNGGRSNDGDHPRLGLAARSALPEGSPARRSGAARPLPRGARDGSASALLYGVLAARLVLLGIGAHGEEEDGAKLHPAPPRRRAPTSSTATARRWRPTSRRRRSSPSRAM